MSSEHKPTPYTGKLADVIPLFPGVNLPLAEFKRVEPLSYEEITSNTAAIHAIINDVLESKVFGPEHKGGYAQDYNVFAVTGYPKVQWVKVTKIKNGERFNAYKRVAILDFIDDQGTRFGDSPILVRLQEAGPALYGVGFDEHGNAVEKPFKDEDDTILADIRAILQNTEFNQT